MAKPIKETPILSGKDAVTFLSEIKSSENKRVTQNESERIKSNFNALKAISNF
ncbi:MAG: hypothetical protein SFY32_11720 [Bacteroidota bacterium]|nr:hypothetical protein [Bacteroidota bacterium]